jgi:hypothetical protein
MPLLICNHLIWNHPVPKFSRTFVFTLAAAAAIVSLGLLPWCASETSTAHLHSGR